MESVRIRCPNCRAIHTAAAAVAGRTFACKKCSKPLTVPGVPVAIAASPSPSSEPRPSRRSGRRGVVVAAAVVVATTAGAIGVVAGLARPKAAEVPARPLTAEATVPIAPAPAPRAPELVAEPSPAAEAPGTLVGPPRPPEPVGPDRPLVVRRRQMLDQEALRRQLAELPELSADDKTEAALLALHQVIPPGSKGPTTAGDRDRLRRAAAEQQRARRQPPAPQGVDESGARPPMRVARDEGAPRDMLAMIREKQPELAELPWRMGDECHLGRESAEDLQAISRSLRTLLAQATPQGDTRPDADRIRAALLADTSEGDPADDPQPQAQAQTTPPGRRKAPSPSKFAVPAAIPALQQLLMAERTPVRLVLVDVLAKIQGPEAVRALARLSTFDLAFEVRERALIALRYRPTEDYRPTLLEALRYPWAPVADHAAEALVALGDRDAVPALVGLLGRPDPTLPRSEVRDGRAVTVSTSLVQVNHLQNCVLCHAPSGDPNRDFVRGRVPDESQPLPPPVEYYNSGSPGLFVRADVTYLRQDFSATQPVQDPGPWPAYQRYDYLIAERPASRWSSPPVDRDPDNYPQRRSVLFALRELTGRDPGPRAADWEPEAKIDKPRAE